MEKLLLDISEYQQKVLSCISSEEINKFFDSTIFAGTPESSMRSEERRVGKECRSRWSPYH